MVKFFSDPHYVLQFEVIIVCQINCQICVFSNLAALQCVGHLEESYFCTKRILDNERVI